MTEQELIEKLRAEKEGLIPKGFAQKIEADLTGSGHLAITRRVALAYLEMPWPETAEQVLADRALAVSMAHVVDVLKGHIQSYRTLVDWLTSAEMRMLAALCRRDDMQSVIAEGKRQSGAPLRLVIDNDRQS